MNAFIKKNFFHLFILNNYVYATSSCGPLRTHHAKKNTVAGIAASSTCFVCTHMLQSWFALFTPFAFQAISRPHRRKRGPSGPRARSPCTIRPTFKPSRFNSGRPPARDAGLKCELEREARKVHARRGLISPMRRKAGVLL